MLECHASLFRRRKTLSEKMITKKNVKRQSMKDRVGKGYSLSLNRQKRGRHARVFMWVSVFKETNFRAGSENIFLP